MWRGASAAPPQMAKRALDSQVLATIFSHEWYIAPVSTANWQAILQGVTNNLASYHPRYVTLIMRVNMCGRPGPHGW